MLFNTFIFWLFFSLVAALNFSLPQGGRKWLLLAASYAFYMYWSVPYILVIVAITLVDYFAALAIDKAAGNRRRLFLALSLISNFGMLAVFKYAAFFGRILSPGSALPVWVVPLGISFHTFQAVSYTVDVYRGRFPAESNLGTYALYVAFFPQMIAGPIERPGNLIPQLREPHRFDSARLRSGLALALRGLVKKVVIADLAAVLVDSVYAHPAGHSSAMLWTATLLFSVQIYCDFSGYSDIAVGTARVLGYDLMINFRQPYLAQSVAEFWRRWHVSLSSWFRDYLYVPLGGGRQGRWRWCGAVLTVFAASGLWHGANLTFVAWGLLHGFFVVAGKLREGVLPSKKRAVLPRVILTNLLVAVAWVFFRSPSLGTGWEVLGRMARFEWLRQGELFGAGLPRFETGILAAAILILICSEVAEVRWPEALSAAWENRTVRWGACAAGIYSLVFFGVWGRTEFIYFQF